MFSKKLPEEAENQIRMIAVRVSHIDSELSALKKEVKDLSHDMIKLDGHVRSLRGAVNRMKGTYRDEEEDIKTSSPTDYLRKL